MADVRKNLEIVISAKDEASRTLKNFSGGLDDLSANIKKSSVFMAGIGVATAAAAKGFIEAAGEMQATRAAFTTLIGDADKARQTLDSLFELEAKTPLNLQEILEGSKRLLAMGTRAEDLTGTFRMLGDVAAGVGKEKLPQLILAFGQIQSRGKLMGTELRQLTEAGFNLADAMGVSNAQLDEMVSNGQVSFEMVRQGFENATSEGGRFFGLMDQLAGTTPGKLSTLESSIYRLKVAFGEALLPALNRLIEIALPFIEGLAKFASEHQTLTAVVIAAGLAFGALGTAVLVLGPIIAGIAATFSAFGGIITAVIGAIGALIAILGGPLTIIIAVVVAAVAALGLAWRNNWFNIRDHVNNVVNWFRNTAWPVIQTVFNLIKAIIENVAKTWIDRFNAIKAVIEAVINVISALINKAREIANAVKGGLKIPGFQHGGFVPGGSGDAVPAILHGGEKVVPRNGVDVNNSGGGMPSVTINISGSFNLDSDSRVQELADRVIRILGRQNELAAKGVGY